MQFSVNRLISADTDQVRAPRIPNSLDFYLGGSLFESRSGYRLSQLKL